VYAQILKRHFLWSLDHLWVAPQNLQALLSTRVATATSSRALARAMPALNHQIAWMHQNFQTKNIAGMKTTTGCVLQLVLSDPQWTTILMKIAGKNPMI
jgi:hypothetical protein